MAHLPRDQGMLPMALVIGRVVLPTTAQILDQVIQADHHTELRQILIVHQTVVMDPRVLIMDQVQDINLLLPDLLQVIDRVLDQLAMGRHQEVLWDLRALRQTQVTNRLFLDHLQAKDQVQVMVLVLVHPQTTTLPVRVQVINLLLPAQAVVTDLMVHHHQPDMIDQVLSFPQETTDQITEVPLQDPQITIDLLQEMEEDQVQEVHHHQEVEDLLEEVFLLLIRVLLGLMFIPKLVVVNSQPRLLEDTMPIPRNGSGWQVC